MLPWRVFVKGKEGNEEDTVHRQGLYTSSTGGLRVNIVLYIYTEVGTTLRVNKSKVIGTERWGRDKLIRFRSVTPGTRTTYTSG